MSVLAAESCAGFSAQLLPKENLRQEGKDRQNKYQLSAALSMGTLLLKNCAVLQVLVAWFDFLVKNPELGLTADLIVYLKTSPEVSFTG